MTPVQVADLQAGLADRYTVERELGRGGMATVYLATDLKHHRSVAIKVLHPEIAAAVGPERFVQEIETIAGLSHPHILPMHDSGTAGGFLFYVMPYAEGETLRDRLDREKQLPLAAALKITRDVAAALDFAHEHDIVHRDIKPDNILLEGDEAVVTDFGISRAISSAGGEKLTETGLVIGTPTYMSPEQGAGDEDIDRRSDVYALGCVLYEMLAGKPPFTGASSRAIIMRHLQEPPPPLNVVRPDLPPAVEEAVSVSLAKAPADRYATAVELAESVDRATQPGMRAPVRRTRRARRLWWAAAVVAVVAVAAVIQAIQPFGSDSLDPSLYVVAPFEVEDGGGSNSLTGEGAQRLMTETLRQWDDVSVVDEHQLSDVVSGGDERRMSHRAWLSASRSVNAGRLVRGRVLRSSDGSLRASGSLYDVGDRSDISQAEVAIASDLSDVGEAFRQLAGMLFGLVTESGSVPRSGSVRATQQFLNGLALLKEGEMASATDSFRAAHQSDQEFAAALLWHAQVMAWTGDTLSAWPASAQAAARLRDRLSDSVDMALVEPLLDLAEVRYAEACEGFRSLVERDSSSYAAWFGLAECHARDHTVLPDPESYSGWRFQSSYVAAAHAYSEGLEIVPFLTPGFYSRLANVLIAEPNSLRWGRPVLPDTTLYLAYPGIDRDGDTLSYVPCPAARGAFQACEPATHTGANDRNAREMLEVMQRALALYDVSARPLILTAEALELNGRLAGSSIENSALIASKRAREVAENPDDSLAAAVVEIRVLTKLERFEEAAALADTTLSRWTTPEPWIARQLAPVAILSGRPNRAASLGVASAPSVQTDQQYRGLNLPLPVLQTHEALVAYAALGAPRDSVEALMARLEALLRASLTEAQAAHARCIILGRPTALAFSILRRTIDDEDCQATDDLYRLQFAYANGDRAAFDREWRQVQGGRRFYKPGEVTADHVYQEAWLLVAWSDTSAAIAHLDRSLEAISTYPLSLLTDPAQPAGLVRAMALRAELAHAVGDAPTAGRWSNAVAEVWSSAEEALRPTVERMRDPDQ